MCYLDPVMTSMVIRNGETTPMNDAGNSRGTVDETLIDATLRLSPEARLELNDRMVATVEELRAGFAIVSDHD